MTRPKVNFSKIQKQILYKRFQKQTNKNKKKQKEVIVFGWLKSNKCECKNSGGKEPLPTVVPQQI